MFSCKLVWRINTILVLWGKYWKANLKCLWFKSVLSVVVEEFSLNLPYSCIGCTCMEIFDIFLAWKSCNLRVKTLMHFFPTFSLNHKTWRYNGTAIRFFFLYFVSPFGYRNFQVLIIRMVKLGCFLDLFCSIYIFIFNLILKS